MAEKYIHTPIQRYENFDKLQTISTLFSTNEPKLSLKKVVIFKEI